MANGNGTKLEYVKIGILGLAAALILGFVIPKLNALDYDTQGLSRRLDRVVNKQNRIENRQRRTDRANQRLAQDIRKTRRDFLRLILVAQDAGVPVIAAPDVVINERHVDRSRHRTERPRDDPDDRPEPKPEPDKTCIPTTDICIGALLVPTWL